jgi:hypothetical protein
MGAAIRWLAPSSWVEQTNPWLLLQVARDRHVHTELMREASRRMVRYASEQIRMMVDRTMSKHEQRFFDELLDIVDKSTTLDSPERELVLKPIYIITAGATADLQHQWERHAGRREQRGEDIRIEPIIDGTMRLFDAAVSRVDLPDRLLNAVRGALEYPRQRARTTSEIRRGLQRVNPPITELIKRAIHYPHPRDIGALIAHGDGWAMYDRSSPRRPGRVGVQLSPGLAAPAAQFTGWVEGTLHEALDVVGHLGSPSMKDAARQLGAQGLLA